MSFGIKLCVNRFVFLLVEYWKKAVFLSCDLGVVVVAILVVMELVVLVVVVIIVLVVVNRTLRFPLSVGSSGACSSYCGLETVYILPRLFIVLISPSKQMLG